MTTVNLKQFEESFVIHFGGHFRRVNAYTLASTLVALADAAKEANSIINPGYEVEVIVEALGPGSFRAKIRTVYRGLNNLFSKDSLKTIVLGVIAAYIYQHTLAPDIDIIVNVSNEEVVIQSGEQTIIVPREVHDASKVVQNSEQFRRSIGRVFEAVEKDEEIEALGITDEVEDEDTLLKVDRSRFAILAHSPEIQKPWREIVEVAELQILRAILERSKRRWEFVWHGIKISAPVLDDGFYRDFFAHRIRIAPGDSLKVKMKINQKYDVDTGIYTNESYEVTDVINHIPKLGQETFDTDSN